MGEQVNLFSPDTLRSPWGPDEVDRLREKALECAACSLCTTRINVVFGEGENNRPVIAFVGEGPGAVEDQQGRPFVGPGGKLLDSMLGAMKLPRSKVYICNVVACRPPQNRKPTEDEAGACREFLFGQLRAVRPHTIVALGTTAAQAVLQTKEPLAKLRNDWHECEGIPVRATFHLAFLLRTPQAKRHAWEDLKAVMRKLGLSN